MFIEFSRFKNETFTYLIKENFWFYGHKFEDDYRIDFLDYQGNQEVKERF